MPYADPRDPRIVEARRRHYQSNKAAYLERALVQRKRSQEFVRSQKLKPCLDCGGTFPPVAMDFDHIGDDKTADLCRMARDGYSVKRLAEEIAKCELVCANCHRVRTQDRHTAGASHSGQLTGTSEPHLPQVAE